MQLRSGIEKQVSLRESLQVTPGPFPYFFGGGGEGGKGGICPLLPEYYPPPPPLELANAAQVVGIRLVMAPQTFQPSNTYSCADLKILVSHFQILASNSGERPQTPTSHEEKWSGEPSRISWASAHFCDSVT